jgi:hypothetical protein
MLNQASTSLIKKPYQAQQWTPEQIDEFTICIDDPIHFVKHYCYIQHPIKGKVKFDLFEYQEKLINTYNDYRYAIAMLPRQTGKSTAAAAYLLWYCMFKPDSTVLIAAHKYAGAQEIMQRVRFIYEMLPDWIKAGCTSYNRGSIEFDNASRIVSQATTENTGRGMSLTLIYLDEFAFVPPRIAQEFWTSISPTLSTGGKCIITSTPNQDNDQFAQIWKSAVDNIDDYGNEQELGKNGFKPFRSYWNEHPDRNDAWAAEERGKIGEERFRREHECEFITADETLISPLKLVLMEAKDAVRKTGEIRWFGQLKSTSTYIIGLDPCIGTGSDFSAIEVFSLPGLQQVAEWQHNKTDVRKQILVLQEILDEIHKVQEDENNIYYSIENNGIGKASIQVLEELGLQNFYGVLVNEPKLRGQKFYKGMVTTLNNKLEACARLKYFVENQKIKIYSRNLIKQLKVFVARGRSFAAKDGEHDDLVMAAVLCVRIVQTLTKHDEGAYEELIDPLGTDPSDLPMPIGFI